LSGFDPLRFINNNDQIEVGILGKIAERAIEIDDLRRKNLAQHIVNELMKALNKGNSKASSSTTSTA